MRKKFQFFSKNNLFFHNCCKNAKIVSVYAYFTTKWFEMCLKRYRGLVCVFRWKKKKRIVKILVFVKIWSFFKKNTQKRKFLLLFLLTPPFFRPETDELPKNHIGHPKWPKCWPKYFSWHFDQNWCRKSKILDPPI